MLYRHPIVIAAQRQIDIEIATREEEIAIREKEILALKTRRNLYCTVSRLPAEILSYIFCMVRDKSWEWYPEACHKSKDASDWIFPSFVCRSWREIALSSPPLWYSLETSTPPGPNEVIRRSQAPLRIYFDGSDRLSETLLPSIMQHISRIEHIVIDNVSSSELLDSFAINASEPAPNLRDLRLQSRAYVSGMNSSFLSRSMPSLTHLMIHNISLPDPLPPLPAQLRSLTLSSDLTSSTDQARTIPEILEALGSAPNLEELILDRILDGTISGSEGVEITPVELPKLAHLGINPVDFASFYVLTALDHPPTTGVDLFHCDFHPSDLGITGIMHVFSHSRQAKELIIHALHYLTAPTRWTFHVALDGLSLFLEAPAYRDASEIIYSLPISLSAPDIHKLDIRIPFDPFQWSEFLLPFDRVDDLEVHVERYESLVALLGACDVDGCLPLLRRLTFNQSPIDWSGDQFLLALVDFLNLRKDSGRPIEELRLLNCAMTRTLPDRLADITHLVIVFPRFTGDDAFEDNNEEVDSTDDESYAPSDRSSSDGYSDIEHDDDEDYEGVSEDSEDEDLSLHKLYNGGR